MRAMQALGEIPPHCKLLRRLGVWFHSSPGRGSGGAGRTDYPGRCGPKGRAGRGLASVLGGRCGPKGRAAHLRPRAAGRVRGLGVVKALVAVFAPACGGEDIVFRSCPGGA